MLSIVVRILILKPSALGDVVQALPVARLLRRFDHGAEIDWWIESRLAPLLENDPDITRLVLFHRQRWSAPWRWHEAVRSILELRAARYDLVLDLQALARSSLVAWLSNPKLIVGLDDPREGAPAFYDVRVPRPSARAHAIDWYLDVLRTIHVPVEWDFEWIPKKPDAAARFEALMPENETQWVAIQPGGNWTNKRWPPEHFAALVKHVSSVVSTVRFVILGGTTDRTLGRVVCSAAPERCMDMTGNTTLPELVECLRRCVVLVGNDSGPMHIAAALGKPVIAVFGPTDPRRTGPYRQTDRVLQLDLPCVPCMSKRCRISNRMACLRDLSPDIVARALIESLNNSRGKAVENRGCGEL